MIKLIVNTVVVVVLFIAQSAGAQGITGQAIYETKKQMDGKITISSPDMNEVMQKELEEKMKKAFEKTYVLDFNTTESLYYEEVKLTPGNQQGSLMMFSSADGKKYKNVKEKIRIDEEDFMGMEFLVTDSLKQWDWKLVNETKKIGGYSCYKAQVIIAVTEEDIKSYEEAKKNEQENPTAFFSVSEPKEQVITVWYTPEIPIAQGPAEYWGLPGLILEANDGETTFLCSKIKLTAKDAIKIKRPKRGKKVNQKEYEEFIEKHLEKMKDENGNIHITIGG